MLVIDRDTVISDDKELLSPPLAVTKQSEEPNKFQRVEHATLESLQHKGA